MNAALRDGRTLGVSEFGAPEGAPVFYFHGLPSCRHEAAAIDRAAKECRARIIAVDRPGFGSSSFHTYRPLARFTDDIVELADQMSLGRFAVLGCSAGGPFALAAAALCPQRVSAVATLGGFADPKHVSSSEGLAVELAASLALARSAPWLMRPLLYLTSRAVKRNGDHFIRALARRAPEPDRALLLNRTVGSSVLEWFRGGFEQGTSGVAWEMRLLVEDWGFSLACVRVPVVVWQGELDTNASPAMGRFLSSSVPGASLKLVGQEGHLSLLHNKSSDVLRLLISQ